MSKPEDWATHAVHDHRMEHWRVTALLVKDALGLWNAVRDARDCDGVEISNEVQIQVAILRRRLELTDYFLSGLAE